MSPEVAKPPAYTLFKPLYISARESPCLPNFGYFVPNLHTFGVLFTRPSSAVLYRNWQISGMFITIVSFRLDYQNIFYMLYDLHLMVSSSITHFHYLSTLHLVNVFVFLLCMCLHIFVFLLCMCLDVFVFLLCMYLYVFIFLFVCISMHLSFNFLCICISLSFYFVCICLYLCFYFVCICLCILS